jgi:hypothetical protein
VLPQHTRRSRDLLGCCVFCLEGDSLRHRSGAARPAHKHRINIEASRLAQAAKHEGGDEELLEYEYDTDEASCGNEDTDDIDSEKPRYGYCRESDELDESDESDTDDPAPVV